MGHLRLISRKGNVSLLGGGVPMIVWLVLTASILVAGAAAGCGPAGVEKVELDSGPVKGIKEQVQGKDIWVFKGIPYAAPPVGELRWKPPQPVTPWKEARVCDSFGPSCPQPLQQGTFYLDVGPMAEDCLYLNVWTPAESSEDRLPVMVWIHGGSFETGSGSMQVYNGGNLATKGVVVVTINYRVGPLGFLAHPALSAESPQGVSGNYGLLDQIAALQWVQRNIASFGGDPRRVTVFGESAGAISILDLLVSPLAQGLFSRAIAESAILLDAGFGPSTTGTLAEAETAGEEFAALLGVSSSGDAAGADVAAQMRAKTPDELLATAAKLAEQSDLFDKGLTWKPVADGYVLPDLPTKLWAAGEQQSMPLLIGTTADEGNLFTAGVNMSREEFQDRISAIFGEYAEEALALYPVGESANAASSLSRMLTEVGFASTARFAAQMMSATAPTYLYQFTRVPFGNPLGAFHSVEIPYVFGNLDMFSVMGQIDQADRNLSAAVMEYWTRFAASGDPNGQGVPTWPRYDPGSDQHLELNDPIATGAGLYKAACDLADRMRGLK